MLRKFTLIALTLISCPIFAEEIPNPSLDNFRDGAKHFRDGNPDIKSEKFTSDQVVEIAANILLYQRENGGWPSNWDPQTKLTNEEIQSITADRDKKDTTFDNRATYPQIEYLANAFKLTSNLRYRDSVLRGLEFMLDAQHPCGGFPHSFPNKDNYRSYITFMDDVTAGALSTLHDAASGAPPFDFLDDAMRKRMEESFTRGIACILKLQQDWNGQPAVWAGQYDHQNLQPIMARSFELPGLVSTESVGVVKLLMKIGDPTPEVIQSIEGAIEWFKASAINGYRLERVEIDPVRFDNHTATQDVRLVEDADATQLWARFYDLGSINPFFANRDGKKVRSLEKVQLERRTGYSWYGNYATGLLADEYPAWRTRINDSNN